MKLIVLLSSCFLFLAACGHGGHHHHHKTPDVVKMEKSGNSFKSHHKRVFLGPQPTTEDLKAFKEKHNVTVVINLRTKGELKGAPYTEADAKKIGLTYYNFPVEGFADKLDPKVMAQIEETFMKHHKNEEILIHCSSGNRAAAWFAYHFAATHKDKPARALMKAEGYGLTNSRLKKKTETLLNEI